MDAYNGTTVYIKDLVIGLKRLGITPEVFTLRMGPVASELNALGIKVTYRLSELSTPDVIHAHHNIALRKALLKFRNTPVVSWIHDRTSHLDIPLFRSNILQYMAVDYNCKERYCHDFNFMEDEVNVIYNWVNLERFQCKAAVANKPQKALVFSNYANDSNYLPVIKATCDALSIELDTIGKYSNNQTATPEHYLPHYDLIFGKAKAAMEGMATGAAVIVCDFRGLAGLVNPDNFGHFRKFNFGMKLMTRKITHSNLTAEIKAYNEADAIATTQMIREQADFEATLLQIVDMYKKLIDAYAKGERGPYDFHLGHEIKVWRATFKTWLDLKINLWFP